MQVIRLGGGGGKGTSPINEMGIMPGILVLTQTSASQFMHQCCLFTCDYNVVRSCYLSDVALLGCPVLY